jgi:streptomycin 6-kinase
MKEFKTKVISTWGKKGEIWLNQLPSIIEKVAQHWQLDNINVVHNLSYNYLALAVQKNKIPVAIKISCDEQLILNEYQALKHFNGQGAIKVFDIDKTYSALLLEQAIPGHLLKTHNSYDIKNTINLYAQVVKELASSQLIIHEYSHVSKWCDVIDQIKHNHIESHFLKLAKQLKSFLLDSSEKEYLCHGDLHLENILQHGKKWLAIDPKGIIGEMTFEAAAFDLISSDEMQNTQSIAQKIIVRVKQISEALNLTYERLLAWIFLRVIISAQWFIEDNGDPSKMLKLADHIYPLLIKHQVYFEI